MDTPRGGNMFGSLVVCLPSRHEGGQLIVRHGEEEEEEEEERKMTFDWGQSAEPKLMPAPVDSFICIGLGILPLMHFFFFSPKVGSLFL